ncbi:MAG: methyl-accepting chemotaxis protein [Oscillospiraceae bacterium]
MKNLSISLKLVIGFGIILAMMIVSIVVSLTNISTIGKQADLYGEQTVPNNTVVWEVRRNIVSCQRYVSEALLDPTQATTYLESAKTDADSAIEEIKSYAENKYNSGDKEQTDSLLDYETKAGEYRVQIAELLENPTDANVKEATELFHNNYVPQFDSMTTILKDLTDQANDEADQQAIDADNAQATAEKTLIICIVAAAILTISVIIIIRKSILSPVNEIVGVFSEISKGNMKMQIKYDGKDELGQMARLIAAANQMQGTVLADVITNFGKISQGDLRIRVTADYPGDFTALREATENTAAALNKTLATINTAAEQVSIGSSQVSSGAQALASGSAEQAASVEELNAAVIRIAEQAVDNSLNVKTASDTMGEAGANVVRATEHMQVLTGAMNEIGSSSNQITNITKVIEDIAFQTNILALNAAIEAARAGNAGKGFAVVADEVRNLAAKSAEAAKQTAALIRTSVETVAKGTQVTGETAEILHVVAQNAASVSDSVNKIEKASAEQVAAIEQIKIGLSQVSSVVQTNAATAEENSATSEEMSAQAATLREEVGKFQLDGSYERDSQSPISLLKAPGTSVYSMPLTLGKY